jgi:hypothetical protein
VEKLFFEVLKTYEGVVVICLCICFVAILIDDSGAAETKILTLLDTPIDLKA